MLRTVNGSTAVAGSGFPRCDKEALLDDAAFNDPPLADREPSCPSPSVNGAQVEVPLESDPVGSEVRGCDDETFGGDTVGTIDWSPKPLRRGVPNAPRRG